MMSYFPKLPMINFPVSFSFLSVPLIGLKLIMTQLRAECVFFEWDCKEKMKEGKPQSELAKALANGFFISLLNCVQEPRRSRWIKAIKTLENDSLFAEANILSLLEVPSTENFREASNNLFKELSSGHAIILLTITKLVELVDDRTLVLLDEPEGHLHPPLLSAFVRTLSDRKRGAQLPFDLKALKEIAQSVRKMSLRVEFTD